MRKNAGLLRIRAAGYAVQMLFGNIKNKQGEVITVDLAEKVVCILRERGLTVGTAESCTGGLIGKLLTDVSGASECYLGGIISYTNGVKNKVLGVKQETLDAFGAVSPQTAIEMAVGARKVIGADIGVSVTGVAGPNISENKAVGTIYIGISMENAAKAYKLSKISQKREENREFAAQAVLELIRCAVLKSDSEEGLYEAL